MLKSSDDIAHLTDECVGATGEFGDVSIGTFRHVSEQGSLDELPVERNEQRRHHAPEQENDGQTLRVRGVPHLSLIHI